MKNLNLWHAKFAENANAKNRLRSVFFT